MTGVYQITCRSNGRRYIGSAFNISRRWIEHRRDLRGGRHCNKKLQHAWVKYGEADFTFETLIECAEGERISKEQFFLDFFKAVATGFNISPVAGTRRGIPQPPHVGEAVRRSQTGKKYPPEVIERMRVAQSNRSPEWRANIAKSKMKANGATRRPIAPEKLKNYKGGTGRIISMETRQKIVLAAYKREAEKREHHNAIS